ARGADDRRARPRRRVHHLGVGLVLLRARPAAARPRRGGADRLGRGRRAGADDAARRRQRREAGRGDMILAADTVDLARTQFGMTSIYHFLFGPLTLGLAPIVAIMQTLWYRTGVDAWLRATRFFGVLLAINFAVGVATGLVQEFQFGMNWS